METRIGLCGPVTADAEEGTPPRARIASRCAAGSDCEPAGTIGARCVGSVASRALAVTVPFASTGEVAGEVVGICAVGRPVSGETAAPLPGLAPPVLVLGTAVASPARVGMEELMLGVASVAPVGDVPMRVPGAVPETLAPAVVPLETPPVELVDPGSAVVLVEPVALDPAAFAPVAPRVPELAALAPPPAEAAPAPLPPAPPAPPPPAPPLCASE